MHTHTETSQYTLTSSGKVVVITSLYTVVASGSDTGTGVPRLNNAHGGANGFFGNTGAVAGTFVAIGIVAAAVAGFLFFFFMRRKKRRQLDEDIRVATGGAGDGGAGFSRFNDDDDDEESFTGVAAPRSSIGHLSSNGRLSSYGAVPLTGAAAAFGTQRSSSYDIPNSQSTTPGIWDPSTVNFEHLPTSSPVHSLSSLPPMQQAYSGYGPSFAAFAAGGPRSHEGILHDDWQDYVSHPGSHTPGGNGGEAALDGYAPASQEGSGESLPTNSQEGIRELTLLFESPLAPLADLSIASIAVGSAMHSSGDQTAPTPVRRDSGLSFYSEEAAEPRGSLGAFRNSHYGSSEGHGLGSVYGGLAVPSDAPAPSSLRIDDRLNPNAFPVAHNNSATSLGDENDYSRPIFRSVAAQSRSSRYLGLQADMPTGSQDHQPFRSLIPTVSGLLVSPGVPSSSRRVSLCISCLGPLSPKDAGPNRRCPHLATVVICFRLLLSLVLPSP